MKTDPNTTSDATATDSPIHSVRWIAKDSTGRELVVYNLIEQAARTMFESSKLLEGEYTVRRAGHIDEHGRLHIDDGPQHVIDRRITS